MRIFNLDIRVHPKKAATLVAFLLAVIITAIYIVNYSIAASDSVKKYSGINISDESPDYTKGTLMFAKTIPIKHSQNIRLMILLSIVVSYGIIWFSSYTVIIKKGKKD